MDPKNPKKLIKKDDRDSGVDNTSESGHSGDEELSAINSDCEDLFSSDSESSLSKKEFQTLGNEKISEENLKESAVKFEHGSSCSIDAVKRKDFFRTIKGELNISIELSNAEEFITDEYKEIISFYKNLAMGVNETIDFSIVSGSEKPKWLNEEKFKRGQKFARDHLFCINFAEMISLFILFAQKSSLDPLIFTGKSNSPFTAFRRYFNTLKKLMSWYEDDIWNETNTSGSKNLTIVRGMHKNVYETLTNSFPEEFTQKITLGDPRTTALWCPLKDLIVEDFRESLLPPLNEVEQFEEYLTSKKIWMNQADMSMTQFGFVGLAVTYPQYFGIYFASDEDLDAFLHLWRGLGYLLGIKDKYNYCNSGLESIQLRTKFFLELIAKPALRNVTYDWEHMCRCLTAGISYYLPLVNFESSLLYLCHILKIKTPRLKKQISWRNYFVFQIHRFTFYLMRFQKVLPWLNSKLYNLIKKVDNAPPDILNKWENKTFSYMTEPNKCPLRSNCSIQDF